MTQQVPNPTIARGAGLGAPPGAVYSGAPQVSASLVAIAPPPVMPTPGTARRQRAFGLIPAQPGGLHPLVTREKPRTQIDPRVISQTRAALRRADAEQRAAESAWIATAPNGGPGDPEKLKLAREALDKAAMVRRSLAEMESAASSRPIAVILATVREPAEVAEEIAKGDTNYVCLHDGCKGQRWMDEAALRRAHPTHADMQRAQQCHVFAILCEAALDPLDPEGEKVGYVAPVGRDGTTVAARAAETVDDRAGIEEEVSTLRAELAEMRGLLAEAIAMKKPK